MRTLFVCSALLTAPYMMAQELPAGKGPKKGSYLYHGQPLIEDNSMFIEEAFNQETGVIQHISNLLISEGSTTYYYTNEIPLDDYRHQFSYTLGYSSLEDGPSGFTDLLINYRPLLLGKEDWALVIPRFTLIVPTGDAAKGLGDGGFGGQFNLAVTKRIGRRITTHWNAGYTAIGGADLYGQDFEERPILLKERDLRSTNLGASVIYAVRDNFNLMAEYVFVAEQDGGATTNSSTFNPGFRFAAQVGKVQLVPGLGLPFQGSGNYWKQDGAFVYLSIEPNYTQ